MNQEKTVELMELITTYFERFQVSEQKFNAWYEILKDHEFESCRKNLIKHVKESSFVPTIADITKGSKDVSRNYSGQLVDNINKVKPYEEIVKEIEERTGRKVID